MGFWLCSGGCVFETGKRVLPESCPCCGGRHVRETTKGVYDVLMDSHSSWIHYQLTDNTLNYGEWIWDMYSPMRRDLVAAVFK